jgi:enoyl-[acyl-carrier protein] reductase II
MNRVLAHTGATYPILQAPMGWIARSPLAMAVSRAGGLGIIETSSGETANCQHEIATMLASGLPFGVNLPIRFLKDDAMLRYVCESGIRFVTTSAGSPAKFVGPLQAAGIKVYHAVPTLESALKCADAGVDGLVVEGSEGGGFKNPEEVSTLVLLQAIREKTELPLIAAGGIVDGRGMAAAFALGAEAIQMGVRRKPGAQPLQTSHCGRPHHRHLHAQHQILALHSRTESALHPKPARSWADGPRRLCGHSKRLLRW